MELFQNPYSTSENSLVNGLIKETQKELAEEAAKQTLKRAIKTGKGSLEDVKNNYEAVNSADIKVYRKEYLVRIKGNDTFTILSKDNYQEWSETKYSTCDSFIKLTKKEQKKLTKWSNILDGISFYNKSCK